MKLIIFDYNGVLVKDLHLHEEAFREIAQRHGVSLTHEKWKTFMPLPVKRKVEVITGVADDSQVKAILEEKENLYIEKAKKEDILSPSLKQIISGLSRKYSLAIVSNTTKRQINPIFPHDLAKQFATILTYEDIRNPKPAPDSLHMVMGKLGAEKSETCYVGDSLSDMKTAKNAGVLAIGMITEYHTEEELKKAGADVAIHTLTELENILASR